MPPVLTSTLTAIQGYHRSGVILFGDCVVFNIGIKVVCAKLKHGRPKTSRGLSVRHHLLCVCPAHCVLGAFQMSIQAFKVSIQAFKVIIQAFSNEYPRYSSTSVQSIVLRHPYKCLSYQHNLTQFNPNQTMKICGPFRYIDKSY